MPLPQYIGHIGPTVRVTFTFFSTVIFISRVDTLHALDSYCFLWFREKMLDEYNSNFR